ncbi:agmatinase [Dapis sp. BLCC M126]|uniref:agmatinase n=1 Tax=Dapis sp. BLCC M126 TaxID=3400189 RepID=UPI003CF870DC
MSLVYPTSLLPFIGSEIEPDYTTAKVVIVPIPYEATTTYRRGCVNGPAVLLDASQQLECYDEELDRETGLEVGIYTHEPIADTRNGKKISPLDMLKVTQETVEKLVSDGKFVIAIGGEHSITNGIVKAYKKIYFDKPFTVIQIDAHGDLRYEYEGSIYNHACVMRRIFEMGLPTIQIGIRAICKEEADLIKEKNLTVFRAREIAIQSDWMEKAIASIQTKLVFLTIDLDGIDPTLIPGVGTPEPGGINWYSLTVFLRRVFELHEVVGCDIMELSPINDSVVSEFTAAKLVYKLIGYQALAQNW